MSMNLTSERCNKRKEPSHIAYDNILGAGLMMQIFEDDMKRTWNEQKIKVSTCTEVGMMQRRTRQVDPG